MNCTVLWFVNKFFFGTFSFFLVKIINKFLHRTLSRRDKVYGIGFGVLFAFSINHFNLVQLLLIQVVKLAAG